MSSDINSLNSHMDRWGVEPEGEEAPWGTTHAGVQNFSNSTSSEMPSRNDIPGENESSTPDDLSSLLQLYYGRSRSELSDSQGGEVLPSGNQYPQESASLSSPSQSPDNGQAGNAFLDLARQMNRGERPPAPLGSLFGGSGEEGIGMPEGSASNSEKPLQSLPEKLLPERPSPSPPPVPEKPMSMVPERPSPSPPPVPEKPTSVVPERPSSTPPPVPEKPTSMVPERQPASPSTLSSISGVDDAETLKALIKEDQFRQAIGFRAEGSRLDIMNRSGKYAEPGSEKEPARPAPEQLKVLAQQARQRFVPLDGRQGVFVAKPPSLPSAPATQSQAGNPGPSEKPLPPRPGAQTFAEMGIESVPAEDTKGLLSRLRRRNRE